MAKVEKRLKPHDNLLYDVICRQAGTLSKSILEAVMNSIDAGATRIYIDLKPEAVVVKDDGKGFLSEQEIDEWFATFGTPHEVDEDDNSTDATYGRFRMGRGQLFAFGKNTWTTNNFVMDVDVRHQGLDFHVTEHKKLQHKGCIVCVDLYEMLDASTMQATEREVIKFCKYVGVELFLNGEQINTPPTDCTWDHETDDGWVRIISSTETGRNVWRSGKGVDIYQQGVYVETIPEYDVGVGGVLVTKLPLKLNFARNQVMRSQCPRWRRMYKLLKDQGQKTIRKKTVLSVAEISSVTSQILSGELKYGECSSLRLFQDVQQKTWSANQIKTATSKKTKFTLTPAGKLIVSFAPVCDNRADKIMQLWRALVLDETLLEQWEATPEEFVSVILKHFEYNLGHNLEYRPIEDIELEDNTDYQILDDSALTPRELMVVKILRNMAWSFWRPFMIKNEQRSTRQLRVGVSGYARAWTDGSTYIAINHEEIKSRVKAMTITKFADLVRLILHEYCHDSPNMQGHAHDAHFYQLFHDVSVDMPLLADNAYRTYLQKIKESAGKLPQNLQLQVMKEAESIQRGLAIDLAAQEKEIEATATK